MRFQNVGDRRVTDRVTDVGQFGLDSIKTPVRILFSKLHSEVDDDLPHPWSPGLLRFTIGVVPFLGDELPMPP